MPVSISDRKQSCRCLRDGTTCLNVSGCLSISGVPSGPTPPAPRVKRVVQTSPGVSVLISRSSSLRLSLLPGTHGRTHTSLHFFVNLLAAIQLSMDYDDRSEYRLLHIDPGRSNFRLVTKRQWACGRSFFLQLSPAAPPPPRTLLFVVIRQVCGGSCKEKKGKALDLVLSSDPSSFHPSAIRIRQIFQRPRNSGPRRGREKRK